MAFVQGERVRVIAYEVLVWISVTPKQLEKWIPGTPCFPAILDTAHTHNFSIQQRQMVNWARLQPHQLRSLGHIRLQGQQFLLHAANVWIHRNQPGERDRLLDRPPHLLELPRGIAVHPEGAASPRLPLLGLRALLGNRLHLTIDGARRQAHLRTASPWWCPW
jgi:hypothetical protein